MKGKGYCSDHNGAKDNLNNQVMGLPPQHHDHAAVTPLAHHHTVTVIPTQYHADTTATPQPCHHNATVRPQRYHNNATLANQNITLNRTSRERCGASRPSEEHWKKLSFQRCPSCTTPMGRIYEMEEVLKEQMSSVIVWGLGAKMKASNIFLGSIWGTKVTGRGVLCE